MIQRHEQPADFHDNALGITADPKVFGQMHKEEQPKPTFEGRRFTTVVHNQGRREVYPPTENQKQ